MIKKERKEPFKLQMEEALARRLPHTHQKRPDILQNLKKGRLGYWGETNLDYHLSFLPDKDYFIFQDLRLTNGKKAFQLDTLVLNPFFALIISMSLQNNSFELLIIKKRAFLILSCRRNANKNNLNNG